MNAGLLIVNADDWGRSAENTDRTFECVRRGTISSVSAMVYMEDSERAAAIARESGADAGLHLNFTTPFSARRCPAQLVERQQDLARYLLRHRFAQAVFHPGLIRSFEYVVAAHLDEFRRLYGKDPSRLDGHRHMHLCANVLLGGLLPRGTVVRRNFSFQPGEKSFGNRLYRRTVDSMLARNHRLVDFFFSLLPLEPPGRLQRIFSLARQFVVEVGAHPGNPKEYQFLTGGEFSRGIEDLPIALRFSMPRGAYPEPMGVSDADKANDAVYETANYFLTGKNNIKVLDAGCGSVSHVRFNCAAHTVGIDISKDQLEHNPIVQEKILGDLQTFSLPKEEFDVVVCWFVVEHLSRPENALLNMFRSLKPGGLLILTFPNLLSFKGIVTKCTPFWFHLLFYRLMKYTSRPFPTYLRLAILPSRVKRLAENHGLSAVFYKLVESDMSKRVRRWSWLADLAFKIVDSVIQIMSLGTLRSLSLDTCVMLLRKRGENTRRRSHPGPGRESRCLQRLERRSSDQQDSSY